MNSTQQRALRLLMEAELSHSEIHDALRRALRALHSKAWCWLQEIYDAHVVYEVNPKPDPATPDEAQYRQAASLFDVTYTVDAQGVVTLGTPAEVRKVVSYEPVAAPAAAAESGSGSTNEGGGVVLLVETGLLGSIMPDGDQMA